MVGLGPSQGSGFPGDHRFRGRRACPGDSLSALPLLLFQGEVTIHYNKLQADPKQGMSLDIGKLGPTGP